MERLSAALTSWCKGIGTQSQSADSPRYLHHNSNLRCIVNMILMIFAERIKGLAIGIYKSTGLHFPCHYSPWKLKYSIYGDVVGYVVVSGAGKWLQGSDLYFV
jgi:hypothetical protein